MEYLLDTHTFLWFINGDMQLSKKADIHRENIKVTMADEDVWVSL
jgi:PIN domain nuclease of toxin-antitoxin system